MRIVVFVAMLLASCADQTNFRQGGSMGALDQSHRDSLPEQEFQPFLEIQPEFALLLADSTIAVVALFHDTNDHQIDVTGDASWASTNSESIAVVDGSAGVIRAGATGTSRIQATFRNHQAEIVANVLASADATVPPPTATANVVSATTTSTTLPALPAASPSSTPNGAIIAATAAPTATASRTPTQTATAATPSSIGSWIQVQTGTQPSGNWYTDTPRTADLPPLRQYQAFAFDSATGSGWMFGGWVPGVANSEYNDLWRWDGANWTKVKGSTTPNSPGVFGTKGLSAQANIPPARFGAAMWVADDGSVWLFGGYSHSLQSGNGQGSLNDMWRYQPTTGNWTWMKGASTSPAPVVQGTLGVAASANTPGSRQVFDYARSPDGKFWLFSGVNAFNSNGSTPVALNDLWQFDPTSEMWTLAAVGVRDATSGHSVTVYPQLGTSSATATPGGNSFGWMVATNLEVILGPGDSFGESGSVPVIGGHDTVWRFNRSTRQWAWVKGSKTIGTNKVKGTAGVAHPDNTPGQRSVNAAWIDQSGNVWLGFGSYFGESNEMWKLDTANNWTVMGPTSTTYPTPNWPQCWLCNGLGWMDASNQMWLYDGGLVWKYQFP